MTTLGRIKCNETWVGSGVRTGEGQKFLSSSAQNNKQKKKKGNPQETGRNKGKSEADTTEGGK